MQVPIQARPWLKKLLWSGLAAVTLIVVVCVWTSFRVVQNVREIAGADPYCIEIADGAGDYRPARTLFDLSIVRMRATGEAGGQNQHHAVLILGSGTMPYLRHWSYYKHNFVDGVLHGQRTSITCVPQRDFADRLPILWPQRIDNDYFRIPARGEAYRILRSYYPKWSGGASLHLSIVTSAPDFAPLPAPWFGWGPRERWDSSVFVEWDTRWFANLIEKEASGSGADSVVEYGLSKSGTSWYFTGSDDVNPTTVNCGPVRCQHRFLNKGRHFHFFHHRDELSNWQALQKRLLALFDSFAAAAAN
ncbi:MULTISPECIES: hypothetical protein [unclassified Beijerinckia]|uniref:hypothetical protein n=1 Tax=unclassified Beijerinckia TaxID=2638183 RepID=UPI0011149091|nr:MULTISPECIES: hypothetical protein [unclassified Beijerinckia]MDH7797860.1 hypothetical protein [Beijerinckia sp. GAS462]